jgi:Asp/Glu/hydantoin racemase
MHKILLINPNTSAATTTMMVRIATQEVPAGYAVEGVSAQHGSPMIVNEAELAVGAVEVMRSWRAAGTGWAGVIVSAFGDPGLHALRAESGVPVAGICEASMLEAAADGRRFGIATVTPDLVASIDGRADELGLRAQYTGIRLTQGDPHALAADPHALEEALARAVAQCIDDGAQAVIIGGGPLGQAAIGLAPRFSVPVIAPIPAAVRDLMRRLQSS